MGRALLTQAKYTTSVTKTMSTDLQLNTFQIALLAVLFNVIFLFHYINILKIKYTSTVLARFTQFFILFFVVIYLFLYNGYSPTTVSLIGFLIILSPYLYFLIKEVMLYLNSLSLKTVRGRFRITLLFLCCAFVFIILNAMTK